MTGPGAAVQPGKDQFAITTAGWQNDHNERPKTSNKGSAMHCIRVTLWFLLTIGTTAAFGEGVQVHMDQTTTDSQLARLQQGRDVLRAGVPQKAIDDYFDPLIAEFEAAHPPAGPIVYSAQNFSQALMYAALPAAETQNTAGESEAAPLEVIVLDGIWGDTLLLKAYALVELGRYSDARETLQKAQALSPLNSHYMSEYAYTFQAAEDWNSSVEHYRKAAELAEFSTDGEGKKEDLGRAWRGEGFALIELGNLGDAEKMFKKCLKLNRKDDKARNELTYIKDLRKAQRK